jgi:hypothetical protein
MRTVRILAALLVALCGSAGCITRVLRPDPLFVPDASTGEPKKVTYPVVVIAHDPDSFWDWHQIKDNLIGLGELEAVRVLDLGADAVTPGPETRPFESAIEWIKSEYASLPRWAPFNILGGLFSALGLEKTCVNRVLGFFPRIIYVTDWIQDSLGELNRLAGHLIPWPGQDRLIPSSVTALFSSGVDGLERWSLGAYVFVVWTLDEAVDKLVDAGEGAWAGIVWVVVAPWY